MAPTVSDASVFALPIARYNELKTWLMAYMLYKM